MMMRNLLQTLQQSDINVLYGIAQAWKVKVEPLTLENAVQGLSKAMADPARAEEVWNKLDDSSRGALQLLIGSGGAMPKAKFERVFGEIRKLGKGGVEREKPYEQPKSVAEGLFYRGVISESFEQTETGMRPIVFIPTDLLSILPLHQTSYSDLEAEEEESLGIPPVQLESLSDEQVGDIHIADTSVVDDMTTILAYLRIFGAILEKDQLSARDRQTLQPFMLHQDENRLIFLFQVGVSGELIEVQERKARPKRAETRKWLSLSRADQLKWLVDAWSDSQIYADLWHVPGLFPDDSGWTVDSVATREAVIGFISELAPPVQAWWSVDDFIALVKENDPDFQRPGSNYDSWYIRNADGDYLQGFESWDAVDGAVLEFILTAPMHWLGLADVAEGALRLTAYGRAYVHTSGWLQPQEVTELVQVNEDATFFASRKVARVDRFQLARFTDWQETIQPYLYKLTAESIQRADRQGITTSHIAAFLNRHLDGDEMPPAITALLEAWQGGAVAEVTFERMMVLRTTSSETMDRIYNDPAMRRYLGVRLGAMACAIRGDRWEQLMETLGEAGIRVDMIS